MQYRPERGDLLLAAGVGWRPGVVGNVSLAVDFRSPAGRAFQTGAPLDIADVRKAPEFRLPDVLREHGIVSLVNVPVMVSSNTWGVLEVDHTEPFTFDKWDMSFLTTVANIMGVCLALYASRQKTIEAAANAAIERAAFRTSIRELQHRTKNNLQIISSLIAMKLRELSPDLRAKFDAVIGRIQAIALAHDQLANTSGASSVRFDDYLRALCANLDPQRSDVAFEVEADAVELPLDRAIPAGLVVNELVTNCLKYAFANSSGKIHIHFSIESHSTEACVSVADTGRGWDVPPAKGTGLSLVEALAQQLQGHVSYPKVEEGAKVVLCFPVAIAKPLG
jgi:two-component sensor histidine kinase/putative methionine-R-sulfoxide reductase with GAF domain